MESCGQLGTANPGREWWWVVGGRAGVWMFETLYLWHLGNHSEEFWDNLMRPCLNCGRNYINKGNFIATQGYSNDRRIGGLDWPDTGQHTTAMHNEWMMWSIIYAIASNGQQERQGSTIRQFNYFWGFEGQREREKGEEIMWISQRLWYYEWQNFLVHIFFKFSFFLNF